MKVRPLQFPTYVFNKAGEMRHCKDRDAFDALGPGWENNPAIVEQPATSYPGDAADEETGDDAPDVKWDEGAHAPAPEPEPLNAFKEQPAAPAAKPAPRKPKTSATKPATRRKG
jgi:hypothetical protein